VNGFLNQILDPDLIGFAVFAWWVFCVGVNVFLSVRVFEDARTRARLALRISPGLWLAISLAFPALGAIAYFVAHPPARADV